MFHVRKQTLLSRGIYGSISWSHELKSCKTSVFHELFFSEI